MNEQYYSILALFGVAFLVGFEIGFHLGTKIREER